MTPLIAGNWKMNGTLAEARSLAQDVLGGAEGRSLSCELLVCPPFVHLPAVGGALGQGAVRLGGQDCHTAAGGAHTGDVSAAMLRDLGCGYVILGHSERRADHGEDNALVRAKAEAALAAGLVPIVCVGETLEERESNVTEEVVGRQIDAVIEHCGVEMLGEGVIAYEPVWAIGTGKTATPEQAQEVHAFIRGRVAAKSPEVAAKMRILYGGSMKPDNAVELMSKEDIDGGLIGGASLQAADFLAICKAAN